MLLHLLLTFVLPIVLILVLVLCPIAIICSSCTSESRVDVIYLNNVVERSLISEKSYFIKPLKGVL